MLSPPISGGYTSSSPLGTSTSETNFNSSVECAGLIGNPSPTQEYIGNAKGFCLSGTNTDPLVKTGCIESEKINNLTLFKTADFITNVNTIANNDPVLPDGLLEGSSTTGTPYSELSGAPYLVNKCRELCLLNSSICQEYGVKFPESFGDAHQATSGCYILNNTCTCANGTPATGPACTSNGAEICGSCNPGYSLDGNQCAQNTCTCANGTPATGPACTSNGAEICGSCNPGYSLDGNQCAYMYMYVLGPM